MPPLAVSGISIGAEEGQVCLGKEEARETMNSEASRA